MSRTRFILGAVLSIIFGAFVAVGTISAADGERAGDSAGLARGPFARNQIVGTWEATVSRGPLPAVKSLHTFTSDGTMIESGSDSAFRSPAYGVWEYTGNSTYATTAVFHRFNTAGDYIGSLSIKSNRRVSSDGETYVGVGVNDVLDPNGNVLMTGRSTILARRMHVEPIPDQP